jgi:hypothetical protein
MPYPILCVLYVIRLNWILNSVWSHNKIDKPNTTEAYLACQCRSKKVVPSKLKKIFWFKGKHP